MSCLDVNITNWNCQNASMVLDASGSNGSYNLVINNYSSSSQTQIWTLIPNLVTNAATGGFTISSSSLNLAAEQPAPYAPIPLGDDPTPFSSASYCWTLWPAGNASDGTQLWAIQDSQRGYVMDASGGACSPGTSVLFWNWNGGDNQKWTISPV